MHWQEQYFKRIYYVKLVSYIVQNIYSLIFVWLTHQSLRETGILKSSNIHMNFLASLQGYMLSLCLFNLYAEYIMRNFGLDETQAGIKISRRNSNNLRYADDTTLMAESEELKSLLMKVKEEREKAGLKLNIQKTKIMASGPISSWQIDGETMETVADFIFLHSKITANGDYSHEIIKRLLLGRKIITNLDSILKNRDTASKGPSNQSYGFSNSHV